MLPRLLPLFLSSYLILIPNSYSSSLQTSDFKSSLSDTLQSTHDLQKTLKGTIFCLSNDRCLTVGPPNMLGNTLNLGMPKTAGTITIGGYTTPEKKNMSFFASEIHKQVESLIAKEHSLPNSWQSDDKLNSCFETIKKEITYLEIRDKAIQQLVQSPYYKPRLSSLAVAKQVIAMNQETNKLNASLKSSEKEINNKSIDSSTWSMAHRGSNWK